MIEELSTSSIENYYLVRVKSNKVSNFLNWTDRTRLTQFILIIYKQLIKRLAFHCKQEIY